ncbi:hypothetical protein [Paenibacillus lentus]|uniref:hypothetical protein n=1 Tax=Paenibacillus lentus TaxID=1338368 RepID=UPI001FE4B165|nr:hypothetical protein [Paenibacillus lentus]
MKMDNCQSAVELWMKYAPYLMFDLRDPFYPDAVGVTIFQKPGGFPSFRRQLEFGQERVSFVIEYAIWWDYEIGHLYGTQACLGIYGA